MPLSTDRCAEFLVRWRLVLLALAALLAATAAAAPQPVWTRSVESMFAPDDPLLAAYRRLQQRFAGNQVVLAVLDDPELLQADGRGVERVAELAAALGQCPGVRSTLSLAQLNRLLSARPGALLRQLSGKSGPPILDPDDPLASGYRELFQGYTHGANGTTAAVACLLEPDADVHQTVTALQRVVEHPPGDLPAGYLAGEPVMISQGFSLIERDGRLLAWASSILLSLVILLLFRSVRWVLAAVVIVQASLLWTRAAAVALHLRLSLVSSVLGALVTVVGVATVIHLIVRIREGKRNGLSTEQALRRALAALLAPIFWACVTDAIGFAALMLSQVEPVRDFGAMMALGVMMVLLAVALLAPSLALWAAAGETAAWSQLVQDGLQRRLARLLWKLQRRRGAVLAGSAAVGLLLAAGTARLQVETDFTRNFRSDSTLVRAYQWIEQRLGGAGVLDVMITAPRGLDQALLDDVLEVERRLRRLQDPQGRPLLTKVVSLADAERIARQDPLLGALPLPARWAGLAQAMPSFAAAMWKPAGPAAGDNDHAGRHADDDGAVIRIMLRASERQTAAAKQLLIAQVQQVLEESLADSPSQGEVTGVFVLLTHLINSLLRDQWICFLAAALGIVVTMAAAFRSLRLAVIALAPNAIPVLVTMGVLGWLNIRVNMGAAMISAVSLGLSVDSSIHYLVAYQAARRQGAEWNAALAAAQQTVGAAMVCSTLALVAGFVVLCFSQFIPTAYFGGLVSLAMLGGLAGNLVVLPLLIAPRPPRSAAPDA